MSNGGAESGRLGEQLQAKRKYSGTDFVHAIAKIAVAQICESAGYNSFQQSALETLSEVAVHYIQNIGKTANSYANLAGRIEGNIFDVIQGLEELGSGLGFAAASDIDHCLVSSGIVRDIIHYIGEAEDVPFAYSVPSFPALKDRKPTPSFLQIGEEPPEEHIPAWLPAFPDPQSYIHSEKGKDRGTCSETDKIEQAARQQRKTEQSLLNLQHIFASDRLEGPSVVDRDDDAKAKQAAESNPFLAAPQYSQEKGVSPAPLPSRLLSVPAMKSPVNEGPRVSVLETFAPAIEAMKSRLRVPEDIQKKKLLNQRPLVQFKIGVVKKSFSTALDWSTENENENTRKVVPLFGNNEEKDEQKRRAEKILKESMENTETGSVVK